jgi:NADP-dependent 3-hydroxy acid dehydrogenase YdfG
MAGPKNSAAMWLHQQTLDQDSLDIFAVISSTSADLSMNNSMVYCATNALLNSFVRYRRSLRLPACALNMMSLSDVGILANDHRMRQAQVKHSQRQAYWGSA